MILYGFGPKLGLRDPSPFVLKIHTFLRLSGIEYKAHDNFGNLQKAPKGKMPYIVDNGRTISDSSFIIEYLKDSYSIELDKHLSTEQLAEAYFIQKAFDENFYWCIVYSRWIQEDGWKQIKELFFASMPFPLKVIAPPIARSGVKKSIIGHGLGKHSEQEILHIAKQHLDHFDAFLGDKPYCFGDEPTSLDATAYAFLSQVTLFEMETPLSIMAKKYERLAQYCDRMHQRYYDQ